MKKRLNYFILIASMLIVVLFTGCKSVEYIEVPTIKTEYVNTTDSIYIHDSIFNNVYTKGDTVFQDKYVYKYIYKNQTDTLIKIDSISYPVEVVKVENHLTKCQSRQIVGFWFLLISILGAAGYYIYKKLKF